MGVSSHERLPCQAKDTLYIPATTEKIQDLADYAIQKEVLFKNME